jgi:hypothetical protein
VLHISDVDINFTDLDTPVWDETPMPHRTFKVLHHMPAVFINMALVMGGLFWVIERRERLASERAEEAEKLAAAASPDGEGLDAADASAESGSSSTPEGGQPAE